MTLLNLGSEKSDGIDHSGARPFTREVIGIANAHCTSGLAACHSTRDGRWHPACLQCDRSPGRRHTSPWGRPAAARWEGAAQWRAGHHVLGERFQAPSWH